MSGIGDVVEWLMHGAPSVVQSEDVLAELCGRLTDIGLPLYRVAMFVNTLHPEIMGRRFLWQQGAGTKVSDAPYEFRDTEEYRSSPVVAVHARARSIRRRLVDPDCPMDFPVLDQFRAEGVTDYLVAPMDFSDGSIHVASWSTREPHGFSDADLAVLETLRLPLARAVEIRALRRTAGNLLNTYVGHQTGERVLAGKIRRGHVEAIDAVIWLSDMRGFTALSERLGPQQLVDLLNRYFECQVPSILDRGGEVLKFMGDGLLAIFPFGARDSGREGERSACTEALAAARAAEARIAALSAESVKASERPIRFGLALHLGNVMYGNIGGGNRLDFTCVGPAVNLAARLERLTARVERTIVASAAFAAHLPEEFVALGEFSVAGFDAPQAVFAPAG